MDSRFTLEIDQEILTINSQLYQLTYFTKTKSGDGINRTVTKLESWPHLELCLYRST